MRVKRLFSEEDEKIKLDRTNSSKEMDFDDVVASLELLFFYRFLVRRALLRRNLSTFEQI